MTRTRRAWFGVVLALILGGCSLPWTAAPEPKPARPSRVGRQGQAVRGRAEHWELRDSPLAGSVLEVEFASLSPDRLVSEVIVARRGRLRLRLGSEVLLSFAFDRVVTDHAMGTRYETYCNRSGDDEATIASEIAGGKVYELRLRGGTHGDLVAGLVSLGQVDR